MPGAAIALAVALVGPPPLALAWSCDSALPVLLPGGCGAAAAALPAADDRDLQRALSERLAREPRLGQLAAARRLAVGVVDLRRPEAPRFAGVNPDTMLYAASLPKIALLLAAEQALEDGTLAASAELTQDLHDLVRVSSNAAATRVIDRLGLDRIAATLTDPRYRFFDPGQGGGLWVGKRYAAEGERRPEPLRGLVHAATARQVCRFYQLLAGGCLVSAERSRQMLDFLFAPGIFNKFACALEARPAAVYRKSGTWRTWHSDSVLVWDEAGARRYVLVALVEDPGGERILQQLVPVVEEVLASPPRRPAPAAAAADHIAPPR